MHDIGLNAGDGRGVECDCGDRCADLTAWHRHTVHTYNDPDQRAIHLRGHWVHAILQVEPGQHGAVTVCTKVGCAGQGNGGECWTLDMDGYPTLFGLPSRQIAQDIARRGGVVSTTYQYSTC